MFKFLVFIWKNETTTYHLSYLSRLFCLVSYYLWTFLFGLLLFANLSIWPLIVCRPFCMFGLLLFAVLLFGLFFLLTFVTFFSFGPVLIFFYTQDVSFLLLKLFINILHPMGEALVHLPTDNIYLGCLCVLVLSTFCPSSYATRNVPEYTSLSMMYGPSHLGDSFPFV